MVSFDDITLKRRKFTREVVMKSMKSTCPVSISIVHKNLLICFNSSSRYKVGLATSNVNNSITLMFIECVISIPTIAGVIEKCINNNVARKIFFFFKKVNNIKLRRKTYKTKNKIKIQETIIKTTRCSILILQHPHVLIANI